MAITPLTGFKSFTFDGEVSTNYGVQILGEGVFNAPERSVEMIEIPGRNGAYALDKGRFENIEVTYPANIIATNTTDFADAVSDLRNMLCSRKGYCRLTDDYHPNEYRMAVYKSGLEVDEKVLRAGEFDIVFECKPQRWLTDGEAKTTMGAWGDTTTVTDDIVEINNSDGILSVKDDTVAIEAVQSGSGTPSPSNVRAISGWTDVNVYRTGKNLLNLDRTLGTPNPSAGSNTTSPRVMDTEHYYVGLRPDNYYYPSYVAEYSVSDGAVTIRGNNNAYGVGFPVSVKPNSTYTLSAITSATPFLGIGYYDADWNYVTMENLGVIPSTFTVPSNVHYAVIILRSTSTTTAATWTNIQLELGSTATTYEPYNGTTYNIDLSSAGTVYGGTLDVTTGELTVTHGYEDLGNLTWGMSGSGSTAFFYANTSSLGVSADITTTLNYICSNYSIVPVSSGNTATGMAFTSASQLRVRDATYTSASDFETAMNGVQLVYELATPTTVSLTAEEVELITGTNYVWADTGDSTIEYGQDPSIIVNPTLFDASPMLEVEGYGTINCNGYEVEIENKPLGRVLLMENFYAWGDDTQASTGTYSVSFDPSYVNIGDTISFDSSSYTYGGTTYASAGKATGVFLLKDDASVTTVYYDLPRTEVNNRHVSTNSGYNAGMASSWCLVLNGIYPSTFTVGTASTFTASGTVTYPVSYNGSTGTSQLSVTFTRSYDGDTTFTTRITRQIDSDPLGVWSLCDVKTGFYQTVTDAYANSTVSTLGHPTYIDCDLGVVYMIENGTVIDLNSYVDLGSDLPVLSAGANTITSSGHITDLKVVPRWWKV